MDKLASVTIVTGPATFIIPFSGLLSSNISRGSCFSAVCSPGRVEHTLKTVLAKNFPENQESREDLGVKFTKGL